LISTTSVYSRKTGCGRVAVERVRKRFVEEGLPQNSTQKLIEFAVEAAKLPLAAIIYTDIAKDGMMTGPNLERTKRLIKMVQVPVIASGGVREVRDIKKLLRMGAAAVIIGRSLYEGTLNLSDAINAAK
jgi:phosphoribosylformimino-5-aminoimidazole carboxamide ribotide isomerase